ncbi:MAG: transpeptidase family protein [Bacteroidota bacterium]|nr:transpeptidase family protein [Bacteroidota bacterium]
MNIKNSILLRVRLAFLLIFLFAMAIVTKIIIIQFVDGHKWQKMAEEIGLQHRVVKATRGNIYSDNGSLMATSLPVYKVALDPSIASDDIYAYGIDSLAHLLSRHFKDKSKTEYKRKINDARLRKKMYLALNSKQINYQEKKLMASWPIFREGRHKGGVIFEKVDKRVRPFSQLGFRTIGFIHEDGYSRGLEYSFNEQLSGKDGMALYQKMAGNNWKPVYTGNEVKPVEGYDIETTIDINLQDVAESALLRRLKEYEADYGCVVVMEVETGEIKAISNLSRNSQGQYIERYNYAVASQGSTEPGSTFKLASMIALLEDAKINLEDTIDTGKGGFLFYDRVMRDSKPGGYGKITIKEAFEKSSNIAISKLVNFHFGHDPQRYIDHIYALGLARPLGFQMIGEAIPKIKNTNDPSWSGTSLPWISIGYEVEVTPLQTLALYNAVANNGKFIQPIIVRKAFKADQLKELYQPAVINERICSEETLKKIKILLEGVVENGTAKNIRDTHYKVAGKTGTARILSEGKYVKSYYASFAGYFPADRPRYSCIVVINDAKGIKQFGSDVAAPVFKEIADKIYARDLKMHSPFPKNNQAPRINRPSIYAGNHEDLRFLCNQLGIRNHSTSNEEWVGAENSGNAVSWTSRKLELDKVPDVKGMTLKDALYLLENKGMRVIYQGRGRVKEQSQPPGSKALDGSIITIKLS